MKILYVSTARVPDNWAHTLQIMKTCEALVHAGAEVELVVPRRHSTSVGDAFAAMGVKPIFKLTRLWTLDLMQSGIPFAFNLMTFTYFFALARYVKRARFDALYVRGELVLPLTRSFGKRFPIFWETHERPRRENLYRRVLPQLAGLITVTKYYRQELIRDFGVSESRVLAAPDAVDLSTFDTGISKADARKTLDLPLNRTIALYAGTDIAWKGLKTLREAALELPENYLILFIGDINPDTSDPRKLFAGFRDRKEIPTWLAAADALVVTGTNASETSARYTSPLKLFEYLAAARPIVASDLSSMREILDDNVAYFAAPDDARALAEAIERATTDPGREAKAVRAKALAQNYSWRARGQRILDFIQSVATR